MLEEWLRNTREQTGGITWFQSRKGKLALVIIVCLGLLVLIWPSLWIPKAKTVSPTPAQLESGDVKKEQRMSRLLEQSLSQIEGAGEVQVSVVLASDGVRQYASNTREETRDTEEKAAQTTKTVREATTTRDLAVSSGNPLLVEEKTPEVVGVLVISEGAARSNVREQLTSATATLLNIPVHRVMVVAGKGGR